MNEPPASPIPALEGPPDEGTLRLSSGPPTGPSEAGPRTLAIDIGGTGLKASIIDATGAASFWMVRGAKD
jgi:hypothetical protein